MQNKKKLVFSVIIVLLVCVCGFLLFKIVKKDSGNLSLSRAEKNWITSNKNQLIDIAILNKISLRPCSRVPDSAKLPVSWSG